MHWQRIFQMTSALCCVFVVHFQPCTAVVKPREQLSKPPSLTTPSSWAPFLPVGSHDAEEPFGDFISKLQQESRGFRLGLFGGGSRNMTINLTNLAVLGLGMAAAVSLYSFFENPGLGFKRSMSEVDHDNIFNHIVPMINHLTSTNDSKSNHEDVSDETKQKLYNWLFKESHQSKLSTNDVQSQWKNIFNGFWNLISELKTKQNKQDQN